MAEGRSRERVRSRIDDYPPRAREELDALLKDVRYTYQDIADIMTEKGWPISKSSIGRYAGRSNAAMKRIQQAAEQTRTLIQAVQDNRDLEATEVCSTLLLDGLTRRLATADEEFDDMSLEKAGNLLVQLQRSGVYKARFKETRQRTAAQIEKIILERLRQEVQADETLLERLNEMVSKTIREVAEDDG